jgi:nanoRNase/pAp phosphatase (c-di-AMP/oligoRNAs hydrolase)
MKCFYHSADLDGHCSGAIVAIAHPDAELVGIDHGDPFPWEAIEKGETVYMVDFSLSPPEAMLALDALANLVWIDHHRSAIGNHGCEHIKGVRRIGTAACELCWEYFAKGLFSTAPMPIAVRFLGRYDVNEIEENENILPFQYGMRNRKTRPEEAINFWRRLLYADISEPEFILQIIAEGKTVLRYIAEYEARYARMSAYDAVLDGLRFVCVNKLLANSRLFREVYDPERHDGMLAYGWAGDKWKCALYTDKTGLDLSAVAKRHGGGGHAQAAGFVCEALPFERKMRSGYE